MHPPTTGDTSTQEREGWEYQEILLQSPQQRCLTSNGSREASSVLWSWPADTKCPCGVEKTPAGTSPGAAQEQHSSAEPWGPHGRRELGVSEESGISDPQSPYSRMGERRDETFPVHWRTIEKPQQEGRWSCWCPTELVVPHRAASSQELTVLGVPDAALSTPLGQAQRNPCAGLSSCGWLSPESRGRNPALHPAPRLPVFLQFLV